MRTQSESKSDSAQLSAEAFQSPQRVGSWIHLNTNWPSPSPNHKICAIHKSSAIPQWIMLFVPQSLAFLEFGKNCGFSRSLGSLISNLCPESYAFIWILFPGLAPESFLPLFFLAGSFHLCLRDLESLCSIRLQVIETGQGREGGVWVGKDEMGSDVAVWGGSSEGQSGEVVDTFARQCGNQCCLTRRDTCRVVL